MVRRRAEKHVADLHDLQLDADGRFGYRDLPRYSTSAVSAYNKEFPCRSPVGFFVLPPPISRNNPGRCPSKSPLRLRRIPSQTWPHRKPDTLPWSNRTRLRERNQSAQASRRPGLHTGRRQEQNPSNQRSLGISIAISTVLSLVASFFQASTIGSGCPCAPCNSRIAGSRIFWTAGGSYIRYRKRAIRALHLVHRQVLAE
jgi:hypothetical protein